MFIMDNPDGTKPPIPLSRIQDFYSVKQGTKLWETKLKASFSYLGVFGDHCIFVQHEGTIYRYLLDKENIYKYDAGSPQRVVMSYKRSVNAEELKSKGDYHTGILYEFQVEWATPSDNTKGGVLVKEIIEPLSAEGWFAQAPDRKQEIPVGIAPDWTLVDLIGISAAKTASSASATETASVTPASISASPTTSGTTVLFQHFEYISQGGEQKVIPNSGFLLTKLHTTSVAMASFLRISSHFFLSLETITHTHS